MGAGLYNVATSILLLYAYSSGLFFIYLVTCEAQKTLTNDSDKWPPHKDKELLESGVILTILRL